MLTVLLFTALALVAMLPSAIFVFVYLKVRGIEVAERSETIPKFLEVAPVWLKAILIVVNICMFIGLAGGLYVGLSMM